MNRLISLIFGIPSISGIRKEMAAKILKVKAAQVKERDAAQRVINKAEKRKQEAVTEIQDADVYLENVERMFTKEEK